MVTPEPSLNQVLNHPNKTDSGDMVTPPNVPAKVRKVWEYARGQMRDRSAPALWVMYGEELRLDHASDETCMLIRSPHVQAAEARFGKMLVSLVTPNFDGPVEVQWLEEER